MTAVDHAELKRAEERIAEIAALFGVPDGGRYLNDWKARAKQHAALLSEIEGLKAERDEARRRRDEWRKKTDGFDAVRLALREKVGAPWPPNLSRALWAGIAADERARADEAERQLAALRTQAPDSWRPDREAVARLVDETVWAGRDETERCCPQFLANYRPENNRGISRSLAKADAILALRPQTAESGE